MLWYSCYFMFLFFNPVNKGKGKLNLTLILRQQSYYIAISYHSVSHQINTWHYWAELFTLTFIRSFCLQFCTQECTVNKKRARWGDTGRQTTRESESEKDREISWIPGEVRMLRLRVKSSLSALRTAVISPFTSSKLMMSSTSAELMFTLADWPFALAWKMKRGKERKALREECRLISKTNNI